MAIECMLSDDFDLSVAVVNIAVGYFDPIEVHDAMAESIPSDIERIC